MSENVRSERAAVTDPGMPMPGSGLHMERFPHGALAGQPWINASGLPAELVRQGTREIALALSQWTEDLQRRPGGAGSNIFDRNAYVPPDNIFEQMRMAERAIEQDDTVGALVDATEGLALRKMHWESTELDEADVFNQWAAQVDLDSFIRVCWRELAQNSQYVAARWWGFSDFKVRGRTEPSLKPPETDAATGLVDARPQIVLGSRRKKTYSQVFCPQALTVLDSTKVVPLGSLMFGQERLVWLATPEEMTVWSTIESGTLSVDPIMSAFFLRRYRPSDAERVMLQKLGANPERLLEMNPSIVWRHTLTRPHYKPWATLRMKRVFRFLDMKQQLLGADRVNLVGNANYILLVKKGEKDAPATQSELEALDENFQYVARLPVVIGDHTLSIDIITPNNDYTLVQERYDVVNTHITRSMLESFALETRSDARSAGAPSMKTVARGLENRRHGVKRDFEANLARPIFTHPINAGKFVGSEPNLAFSPRNVSLDADAATLQALIAIAQRGDISRATLLEEALDLDEETEAQRREMESRFYDKIFHTAVPFNSPANNPFSPGGGGNDGGPGNSGGGELPPGAGGGGRPPGGSNPAKPPSTTPAKKRAPRGKNVRSTS